MSAALAVLVLACPQMGRAAQPIPNYALVKPLSSAPFNASPARGAVEFEFKGDPELLASLEVSRSNLSGQDGTLADDFRVGEYSVQYGMPFPLSESDAFPGTYRGTPAFRAGEFTPGTYYFQMSAKCQGLYVSPFGPPCFIGPVESFQVVAPTNTHVDLTSPPDSIDHAACRRARTAQRRARMPYTRALRAYRKHRTRATKRKMQRTKRHLVRAQNRVLANC